MAWKMKHVCTQAGMQFMYVLPRTQRWTLKEHSVCRGTLVIFDTILEVWTCQWGSPPCCCVRHNPRGYFRKPTSGPYCLVVLCAFWVGDLFRRRWALTRSGPCCWKMAYLKGGVAMSLLHPSPSHPCPPRPLHFQTMQCTVPASADGSYCGENYMLRSFIICSFI
jgi:hypothetical protein